MLQSALPLFLLSFYCGEDTAMHHIVICSWLSPPQVLAVALSHDKWALGCGVVVLIAAGCTLTLVSGLYQGIYAIM
jgi:hypothetical protein